MGMQRMKQESLWRLGVAVLRVASTVARAVRSLPDSRAGRRTAVLVARAMESRAGRAASEGLKRFADWVWARLRGEMTGDERAMFDRLRGAREPECLLRTKSRVDVGQWCNPWWGGARLWLTVFDTELVLFAAGKEPHVTRLARDRLGRSRYNAVMSELMLIGDRGETRTLRLAPLEGVKAMRYVSD